MSIDKIVNSLRTFTLSGVKTERNYDLGRSIHQLEQQTGSRVSDFRYFLSKFGTRESNAQQDLQFIIALNKTAEFGDTAQRIEARSILILLAKALDRAPEAPEAKAFRAICHKIVTATLTNEQIESGEVAYRGRKPEKLGYKTLDRLSPMLLSIATDGDRELQEAVKESLNRTKSRLKDFARSKSGNGLVDLYPKNVLNLKQNMFGNYVPDSHFLGTRTLDIVDKKNAVGMNTSAAIDLLERQNKDKLVFVPEYRPVFEPEVKVNWVSKKQQEAPKLEVKKEKPVTTKQEPKKGRTNNLLAGMRSMIAKAVSLIPANWFPSMWRA